MIRKFNYTGRIRINRRDVAITLLDQDGDLWFDADLSALPDYGLPPESRLYLEAYRQTNWMRFDFGTLGEITQPKDLHLAEFHSQEDIRFRIKVTAAGDIHMILAQADAIPLLMPGQEESGREPLLNVKPDPSLGDEIYRVDFSGDRPVLLINSNAGNYKEIGHSPAFYSLVYPAVFREILTHVIIIDKHLDDEDMENWRSRWIKFMLQLPGIGLKPDIEESDECLDWIEKGVSVFARKQNTRSRFMEFWRDET